jgi:hypothetical protein
MGSMRISERARLGVATLVALGCAGRAEPRVTISAVTPAAAYSDTKISLVIAGGPFRPVYDIDTGEGRETTELGAFTAFLAPSSGSGASRPADAIMWLSTSELAADLPSEIPPGLYDVEVRDPRGTLGILPMGFRSLGHDGTPPTIVIDQPPARTIVNPGAEVPVAFEADDGSGFLATMGWSVSSSETQLSGTCPLGPNAQRATCRFLFVVPTPTQNGQPLNIVVSATDTVPNPIARAETTLAIGLPPVVGSFEPFEGAAGGGTQISVTGASFIPGTQVLLGGVPLEPNGGDVMSDTLIVGKTPAHDPGPVIVTVRTGAISVAAEGRFNFVGRPEIRAVTPSSGPITGCTPVTIVGKYFRENPPTSIWFGSDSSGGATLQCPTRVGPNRIEGFTPPGAGAVSLYAGDLVGGVGSLPLAFTYLDVDTPDGGAGPAACPCDGGPP